MSENGSSTTQDGGRLGPLSYATQVRLSPAHYAALEVVAAARGTKLSTTIRDLVEAQLRSFTNEAGLNLLDAVAEQRLTGERQAHELAHHFGGMEAGS